MLRGRDSPNSDVDRPELPREPAHLQGAGGAPRAESQGHIGEAALKAGLVAHHPRSNTQLEHGWQAGSSAVLSTRPDLRHWGEAHVCTVSTQPSRDKPAASSNSKTPTQLILAAPRQPVILSSLPACASPSCYPIRNQPVTMGIIKKTLYTTVLTGTAFVGYVAGSTSIIRPLPREDPIWTSNTFRRYNVQGNPSTQDVCIKRIPLSKIRPELLEKEGDLALEFCRGVWAGWGRLPFYASLLFSSLALGI